MTNELSLNGFVELSQEETMDVQGGGIWAVVAGAAADAAVKAATATGALCGMGPVGGAVVIGVCVVAITAGVIVAVNSK